MTSGAGATPGSTEGWPGHCEVQTDASYATILSAGSVKETGGSADAAAGKPQPTSARFFLSLLPCICSSVPPPVGTSHLQTRFSQNGVATETEPWRCIKTEGRRFRGERRVKLYRRNHPSCLRRRRRETEDGGGRRGEAQMEARVRAPPLLPCLLLCLFSVSVGVASAAQKFGINYGQIANNLPDPAQVAGLLRSLNVNKVKLYDADPKVLTSFANTGVEFIIAVGNENLQSMAGNPGVARQWVAQHVQPFLPATRITCVTVGNEVFSLNDTGMMASLLPAMQAVHGALDDLGLAGQVAVSSAHSVNVLATSYPPSSGAFREDLAPYIQPMLDFHGQTGSPFLINAYPFFAYKASPGSVSLPYVLFQPNPGVRDPNTGLTYDNMLYAQIDAVYAAMKAMGHADDVGVRISETGWPSKGDDEEVGATVQNAAAYNGNLVQRIAMGQGTPLKPDVPVDVFVFALFNEDMKPGPTSERNYGLFYPNGSPVYAISAVGSGAAGGSPGQFDPYSGEMFSSGSRPAERLRTAAASLTTLLAALLSLSIFSC